MKLVSYFLLATWIFFLTPLCCFAQLTNQSIANTNSLSDQTKSMLHKSMLRLMKARLRKDSPVLSADERWRRETAIKLYENPECNDYLDQITASIFKKTDACNGSSAPNDTLLKVKYILHQKGNISDIIITGNTNVPVALCLIQAIKNCPTFEKWPDKMRAIVGKDSWEMGINYGFNMTPPSPN